MLQSSGTAGLQVTHYFICQVPSISLQSQNKVLAEIPHLHTLASLAFILFIGNPFSGAFLQGYPLKLF